MAVDKVLSLKVKQGATSPALEYRTGAYSANSDVFLGASATFRMGLVAGDAATIAGAATIKDVDGVLSYEWDTADTSSPGRYYGEFVVTYADTTIEIFPTRGYIVVTIEESMT